MIELIGIHRLDDREIVDHAPQVRQELAQHRAALDRFLKLVGRAQQLGMPLDEGEPLVFQQLVRARLHVMLDQLGLEVEQVLLRRSARHVQVNHPLGLGCEVRRLESHRRSRRTTRSRRVLTGAPYPGSHPALAAARPVRHARAEAPAQWRQAPSAIVFKNWRRLCARASCRRRGSSVSMKISLWSRRRPGSRARWRPSSMRPARPGSFPRAATRTPGPTSSLLPRNPCDIA